MTRAPTHRVFVGLAEIGAAWPKRSTEGRDYLSVKLDDLYWLNLGLAGFFAAVAIGFGLYAAQLVLSIARIRKSRRRKSMNQERPLETVSARAGRRW